MSEEKQARRANDDPSPSTDTPELAGRETDRNRLVHWLLVSGNRRRMVVGLSVAATVTYFLLGYAGVIGVTTGSLIASTFTSAITGVFTIVAVTISINQLVLSRVLGSPNTIRNRIDSVHHFRTNVEEMDPRDAVSPTMPAGFLQMLLDVLRSRSRELGRVYRSGHHPDKRDQVAELEATLRNICDQVDQDLRRDDMPIFRVLSPILTNKFSQHLNTTREIVAESEDLTFEERKALDDLIEALKEVNITRHYFKTLYIHEELATVSRLILLTGLPAVLVSLGIILLYSADTIYVSEPYLLVIVSVGFGIVLLPLNVLFAYGLRVGTIAKMTTTFGTFTPVDEMP